LATGKIRCLLLFLGLYIHPAYALESDAIQTITLEKESNDSQALVDFGEKLYTSKLFSKSKSQSCASCHDFDKGGCDHLPTYQGIDHKPGQYNTPTIFNASLNFRQFWNGRAENLAQAIDDHVLDNTIFDNSWKNIVESMKGDETLVSLHNQSFSQSFSKDTIQKALTAYINRLLTPNSPFDRYLDGDTTAMSPEAIAGYELFQKYGCNTCHQGPNMGGNLFQKMGIYKDYFNDKGVINEADLGLFNVTHKEEDKYVFKVPSLRNISKTAPYMHDGQIDTLEKMVEIMGIYQVGQTIPSYDIPLIVKFLESLNGDIPNKNVTRSND